MSLRTLGATELQVSPLCLGLGDLGTRLTGDGAVRLLGRFLAVGGNFVDTAHCYGFWGPNGTGASERELGAAMRALGCRDQLVLTTKGGHPAADPDYPRPDAYLAPEVIATDVQESLDRLGTDHVELFLLHRDDPRVPVGEVMDALNAQVAAGHVCHLGASNWSVTRLAAANAWAAQAGQPGFAVSQVHFSLADPTWPVGDDPTMRTMTPEMAAWHEQTQLPVMAYSASAGGYFAGREGGYSTEPNAARRDRARQLAEDLNATPTQIALAYLMAQPFPVAPIVGTLTEAHLEEAAGATRLRLTAAQVGWLRDG